MNDRKYRAKNKSLKPSKVGSKKKFHLRAGRFVLVVGILAAVVIAFPVIKAKVAKESDTPPTAVEEGNTVQSGPQPTAWRVEEASSVEEDTSGGKKDEYVYDNLVEYSGDVDHFFTHYLIAYPELANKKKADDLWTNSLTVKEFEGILQSLYDADYMLVDFNTIYEVDADGNYRYVDMMLPEGKKPMVFSFDDVVVTRRDRGRGTIDKYVFGEDGRVWTYTLLENGKEDIRNDNDFIPVLTNFIEEHPDFSFKGAKGIIATTGFNGLLGYDVENAGEREMAQELADYLLDDGWTFASHSFYHYHWQQITDEEGDVDAYRWNDKIASITGKTPMFVWPYGENVEPGTPKYQSLIDYGFRIFCDIYAKGGQKEMPNGTLQMFRRTLDGHAIDNYQKYYEGLFDLERIRDPLRPHEYKVVYT